MYKTTGDLNTNGVMMCFMYCSQGIHIWTFA